MRAAIFDHIKNINVENKSLPVIKGQELLIKVNACGICGTDFHIFEGTAPAKPPVVLGHEYAGEVVEVGSDVNNINVGDKIVVNPNIHCGYCRFCKSGRINLCENLKALGVTLNGGMAEYSIVPTSQAYLLPSEFPLQYAAFAEPLSCCVHGINQSEIKLNDSVAVIGCGTIGLLMIQLAYLQGASKVYAVDISNEKIKLASNLNVDKTFNPNDKNSHEEIIDLTSGGVDLSIECVGNEAALKTAFSIVKKAGSVLMFGLASKEANLKLYMQSFFHKELTLKTSLLNPFTFQKAVDLLVSSKVKVDFFNPTKLKLNDNEIKNIFESPRNSDVIKYMIFPNN